jgi:hypothetical protein
MLLNNNRGDININLEMVKFIQKRMKKDSPIINLTDSGKHNNMRVVRDLQDDGTYRLRQVNWDGSLIPEENYQDPNSIVGAAEGNIPQIFITAHEDKGSSYPEPYQPPDPEPGYEEQLEATGATIIKSETYYPKSGITTNKRSMTHDEIADEGGYLFR